MLNQYIKEHTKRAHQALEGIMVRQLKAVRSEADYAAILQKFYAYFTAVEQAIKPYITPDLLPDYAERRNSQHIREDIETLGATVDNTSAAKVPPLHNALDALSAFYVLEGSIMGGPYIVQMLQKCGIDRGFSFFSGYGSASAEMWGKFVEALNKEGHDPESYEQSADIANQTFARFQDLFAVNLEA